MPQLKPPSKAAMRDALALCAALNNLIRYKSPLFLRERWPDNLLTKWYRQSFEKRAVRLVMNIDPKLTTTAYRLDPADFPPLKAAKPGKKGVVP